MTDRLGTTIEIEEGKEKEVVPGDTMKNVRVEEIMVVDREMKDMDVNGGTTIEKETGTGIGIGTGMVDGRGAVHLWNQGSEKTEIEIDGGDSRNTSCSIFLLPIFDDFRNKRHF
jgi:hypothetical protein